MEATKRGYASLASLPLAEDETIFGALNIYSEDANAFDAEEMRLLTELANDLSFGIIHLRMQKKRESLQRDLADAHRIAHIGSYVWDSQSDTSHWCDEMYNIFGVRRGEIQPSLKTVSEMTHPDDRGSVVEKVRIALAGTGQYESEYRIIRPDGSVRHVNSQGEVRRNEKGEPVGLIGTLTDITAQKEWERTLMETNQKLQQALDDINKTQTMLIRSEKLAALGQLSAGVAHEIKNPLNIIYTSTQLMMMEEGVSGEVAESGKIIMEQVMRAVKIIDNLREFARERKPERKEVDLCPFLEKTMGLVAYEMRGDGIEIAKELPPEPIRIMGDEDQLAQVFLNITNNARDSMNMRKKSYSFEDMERIGWKPKLTVRTREEDGKAKISFGDNGVGISEEDKRKLFTPFFTTKGEGKGTGLGIAIAFGIIENHGGTIEFESEEGKGAVFTVKIPLAGE